MCRVDSAELKSAPLPIVVWYLVCRVGSAQLILACDVCGILALCLVSLRAKGVSASERRGNNLK